MIEAGYLWHKVGGATVVSGPRVYDETACVSWPLENKREWEFIINLCHNSYH